MTPLTAIFDELFNSQPMAHWHSVFAGLERHLEKSAGRRK
jgi:hypothetical protein